MLQERKPQQISYISGNGNPKKASYISRNGTVQSTRRTFPILQETKTSQKKAVLMFQETEVPRDLFTSLDVFE